MIGRRRARRVTITGLGCHVPERIMTNDDLREFVDTTDEWVISRTGIRERRIAKPEEAMTDIALPACLRALEMAGVDAATSICWSWRRSRPTWRFRRRPRCSPTSSGCPTPRRTTCRPAAPASCTRLPRPTRCSQPGLAQRALVVGGDVLSKILDWSDRSTLVLFGDGAGAVMLEATRAGGFLGFELGADGAGGGSLWLPGSGSRLFEDPERFVKMNGREVFKFATRVMVSSAQAILAECGKTVDDIDVYVPHQANIRIINHAAEKLGIPQEKIVVNVDRYGNTSSGSIPLALADAADDGRLEPGKLVLMTGMGAGLTWGSALIDWTHLTTGAAA